MNESTLVPREEMSDLDWLARNVHVWPSSSPDITFDKASMNGWEFSYGEFRNVKSVVTKDQWLSRRAELQNKPSWKDAPEWSQFLGQDEDGVWYWHGEKPNDNGEDVNGLRYFMSSGISDIAISGVLLGDWRDTLEKRPERAEFEPFVSVEDAATAKQSAPKGSGSPILGMVLADLTNRALEGKEKYGEPLLAHNGRNPLWDAYQEALDLAMYLRQAIEEQK